MHKIKRFLLRIPVINFFTYCLLSYVVYPTKFVIALLKLWLFKVVVCFGGEKGQLKKYAKIKDSHLGETCIIVGCGPSLRVEELELFKEKGIFTFGCNFIYSIFEKTKWRPDAYCVSDPGFYPYVNGEFAQSMTKEGIRKQFYIKSKWCPFKEDDNTYFFNMAALPPYCNFMRRLSERIELEIADFGTVVSACFQIANYMGFKRIAFYGVDNDYSYYYGSDKKFHVDLSKEDHYVSVEKLENHNELIVPKNRFRAMIENSGVYFNDLNKFENGFTRILKYSQEKDILVTNITRGGKLEMFGRTSVEEFVVNG